MQKKSPTQSVEASPEKCLGFHEIFSEANAAYSRYYDSVDSIDEKYVNILVQSSISKCLDFNIEINNTRENKTSSFFLVGNSRSICEELIYNAFFSKIEITEAREIAKKIHLLSTSKSILAQTRFFAKNNPLQPTFGGLQSEQKDNINKVKNNLNRLWKKQGLSPNIKNLSHNVGLEATYDYVYHMSSNFVHFNPNHLLRLGWGPKDVSYSFSVENFEPYYLAVSRFLGAILFLGYCYLFSDRFRDGFAKKYIDYVTSKLQSNLRWPEIVTFEEMNQEPPNTNNLLIAATISLMRKDNTDDRTP